MPIKLHSQGWTVRPEGRSRGAGGEDTRVFPGLRQDFLTADTRVAEEVILEPRGAVRGRAEGADGLDLSYDAGPGHTAILAIRHASGALTFHRAVQTTSRSAGGGAQLRFRVTVRRQATRGAAGEAIKAIIIKVGQVAADSLASFVLPRLAERFEKAMWKKQGLEEGWLKVTKDTLAARALRPARPESSARSLLLVHGTFSDTATAFRALAASDFFDRIESTYGDRVFGFDHFTISKTPEQNALMLLQGLPDRATTFDVVTHSRGGLVLRTLVERQEAFGALARRFTIGRAVLVASPNDGTPLATPARWDETVGWLANLLELLPDHPFTTGAAFVANALVWMANHASGDLPGLRSMDRDGDLITAIQNPPGPPADAYSALVANYSPSGEVLRRLLDAGVDAFFGSANDLVVPSEGGWRIDRSPATFIPASRIGCFGPGGNLPLDSVTHVDFFAHQESVDFIVNALLGLRQPLNTINPRMELAGPSVGAQGRRQRRCDRPRAPNEDQNSARA